MKTLFSTAEIHPRDRFAFWHDVLRKTFVDHDSNPRPGQSFEGELQGEGLAGMDVLLIRTSPMSVARTMRHTERAKSDDFFICQQLAGTVTFRQSGRDIILTPGDIALLDPALPYTAEYPVKAERLVLKVPRRLLESRLGRVRERAPWVLKTSEAEHALTSAFLAMLPSHAGRVGPAAEALVREQTLDLLALSLAKEWETQGPRASAARSLALMKVRVAIETLLADPMLDAGRVAEAAGISLRYANAVLAGEDTSIMRLVQARRLDRCRTALGDPAQAHRTISEIAYGWGFSDMTHFGRKFRAAYGMLPRDYRVARHAGRQTP